MMTDTNERRAAPRFPAQANFYVLLVRPGAAARTCRVANLSRVGALVKQPAEGSAVPEPASDVVLRFVGASSRRYHSVLARVRRVDSDGIGLGFAEPLNDEVGNLCRFALGKREAELDEALAPPTSDAMQMDFDESTPRLTVPRREADATEPAPAHEGDAADEGFDEHVSRASTRAITAILIGLVVVAALAAFVAVRNVQLSEEIDRVNERVLTLGTMPASAPPADFAQLESRILQLQQEVAALRSNAEQAAGAAAGAANADLARLRSEIDELKKSVASLTSKPAPVRKETAPAATTVTASGWVVQVAAVAERKEADDLAARVRQAGFASELETANVNGKTYYRVIATGFGSQDQARSAATRIKQELKLKESPWVSKR